jgi:hypothetical protein
MRSIVILTCLANPALADDVIYPLLVAKYEVLNEHPTCHGPGKIAFRVEGKQNVPVEYFPAELTDLASISAAQKQCFIKVRKGSEVFDKPMPCVGDDEKTTARKARMAAFCEAVDQIPQEPLLEIGMTGCLSVGHFEVLDGHWTLSAESDLGSYSISKDLTDEENGLKYLAALQNGEGTYSGTFLSGTRMTPARLRLRAFSTEDIVLDGRPDLGLVVSTEVDLHLLDASQSDCLKDPSTCLSRLSFEGEVNELVALGRAFAAALYIGAMHRPIQSEAWIRCE